MRTYSPKPGDVQRQWHVIDATDVVLGRLASQAATLLRGKHKPIFAPHVDTGDFVIIDQRRQGRPDRQQAGDEAGLPPLRLPGRPARPRRTPSCSSKHPEQAVEKAVKGMLPHNTLGRNMLSKLKVYAGPEHPHQAQTPEPFEITQVAQ